MGKYREMGKVYAKICPKMLKKQTLSCRPPGPTTHSFYLPLNRAKKLVQFSDFQRYILFPQEMIFLELFSFTQGTLFWDTLWNITLSEKFRVSLTSLYQFMFSR